MSVISILTICIVAVIVGIFGVSVGGLSLITVPVLIWMGMEPKNAIATNMFALIFLSISGAIGFRKQAKPAHLKLAVIFSMLTIFGSLLGAKLVLTIDEDTLKKVIAAMMCLIAVSLFFKRDLGIKQSKKRISKPAFFAGTAAVFILGIYGGFFSGGYVTLLGYVLILLFGFTFLQAAFITKVFNIFSSLAACLFFYYHGLIEFSIAVPLAASMYTGAFIGTKLAVAKGDRWVRNLFIIAVLALAAKLLIF